MYRVSTIGKNLLNGKLRPTNGWRVWGTPANFNASLLHYCTDIAQRTSTKLCMMFGHLLGWYIIYTFCGLLPPNRILPAAIFILLPSRAFSYIGSITARHSQWESAKLCGMVSSHDRVAIPFDIGRLNFLV